jgi:hypothetical protein
MASALVGCTPPFNPRAEDGEVSAIVLPSESIVGRAAGEGRVWLLTAARWLVLVDLRGLRTARVQLSDMNPDEPVWGLGRLHDGSLWTLVGYRSLAELDGSGRVVAHVELERPHLGIFGWRDRLILQVAGLAPNGPALVWRTRTDNTPRAFGALAIQPLATRAETIASHLALCGMSQHAELPCWFSHELRIHRVHWNGVSRVSVASELGLTEKPPDLGSASMPPRPVRDAYIDRIGDLWLLAITPDEDVEGASAGASQLAHYDAQGKLVGVTRLGEAARLILSARPDAVDLLSVSGHLRTVRPS